MGDGGGVGGAASDKNPLAFLQNFRFTFPNFQKKKEAETVVEVVKVVEEEEVEKKPGVVRFTHRKEIESPTPSQLKVEVGVEENQSGKTSNPLVLWQVYALGGFLILRWVWGRWQERKARKGSDDQASDPPADDVDSY